MTLRQPRRSPRGGLHGKVAYQCLRISEALERTVRRRLVSMVDARFRSAVERQYRRLGPPQRLVLITSLPHPEHVRNPDVLRRLLLGSAQHLLESPAVHWRIVKNRHFLLDIDHPRVRILDVDFPSRLAGVADRHFIYVDRGAKYFLAAQELYREGQSDYVLFHDCDDVIHPSLLEILQYREPGFVVRKGLVKDLTSGAFFELDDFHRFCGSCHIFHSSVLFTTLVKEVSVFADSALIGKRRITVSLDTDWNLAAPAGLAQIVRAIDPNYLRYILGDHGRKVLDLYAQLGITFKPLDGGITWQLNHGDNHGGAKTPASDPYLFGRLIPYQNTPAPQT
ncbi:MAG: hypothetical protein KDD69_12730 [Bdellovibrionales bacterium]|nr:hypothetical protein [Bdellovibrionales bacterium]